MKEYIVSLNGRRIDSNGFYSAYGVTASTKAEAKRLAAKAKLHYFGTFKGQTVNITAQ
jgi:hypothetical protein